MNLQSVATTISEANQTAVPSQIRRLLSLKSGDKLIWKTDPIKKQVVLTTLPQHLGSHLRGLGQKVWAKTNTDQFIQQLRKDRT